MPTCSDPISRWCSAAPPPARHLPRRGAYYAGPGNKFWKIIQHIGLTDRLLRPEEFLHVKSYGIGLTDIAKNVSGADSTLRTKHFDKDALRAAIEEFQPRALAFNGKKAAQVFLDAHRDYGRAPQRLGETAIYVLPSTSGAASGFWDPAPWHKLARDLES